MAFVMRGSRPTAKLIFLQAAIWALGLSEGSAQTRLEVVVELSGSPTTSIEKAYVDTSLCKDFNPSDLLPRSGESLKHYAGWLEPLESRTSPSSDRAAEPVEVSISNCELATRLFFSTPSSELVVKSSDPLTYDFLIEGTQRRRALLPQNLSHLRLNLLEPRISRIHSELHPSVRFDVIVTESPWHAVSDQEGRLRITSIPQGSYKLHLWHPVLGKKVYPEDLQLTERATRLSIRWQAN